MHDFSTALRRPTMLSAIRGLPPEGDIYLPLDSPRDQRNRVQRSREDNHGGPASATRKPNVVVDAARAVPGTTGAAHILRSRARRRHPAGRGPHHLVRPGFLDRHVDYMDTLPSELPRPLPHISYHIEAAIGRSTSRKNPYRCGIAQAQSCTIAFDHIERLAPRILTFIPAAPRRLLPFSLSGQAHLLPY